MDRLVSRTQFIWALKGNPLLDRQDVVNREVGELAEKRREKAADPVASLESLAEIAEMPLALSHMAGSAGDWQISSRIYANAIPFSEYFCCDG